MSVKTGNTISNKWRANLYYTTNTTATKFSITLKLRLENVGDYRYKSTTAEGYYTNHSTRYTGSPSQVGGGSDGSVYTVVGEHTYTYSRDTSSYNKEIDFSITTKGSAAPGTSSGTLTITIPRLEQYSITYYKTNSSSTYQTQTKYYGKSITLKSANTFNRDGYIFINWNTSSSGQGTPYSAGATYSGNSNLTLYAQWRQDYTPIKIKSFTSYRVASIGSDIREDEGECIYYRIVFDNSNRQTNTTIKVYIGDAEEFSDTTSEHNINTTYSGWLNQSYNKNNIYKIKIGLKDGSRSDLVYSTTIVIPAATFPLDLLSTPDNNVYMGLMTPAQTNQKVTVPELYINKFKITPPTWIELHGQTTGSTTPTKEINSDYISAFQADNYNRNSRNEQGIGGSSIIPEWCDSISGPGVITISQAGYYKIDLQVYFYNGFTVGDIIMSGILKNYTSTTPGVVSDTVNSMKLSQAAPYTTLGGSSIIYCNSGDNIRAYARNSTSNRGSIATSERTRLIVTKI